MNIHDAKTNLSRLIEEVEAGEEVVIARAGTPVARLVPVQAGKGVRLGALKGKLEIPADFGSLLPENLLSGLGIGKE